jgi:hypothetical protein
MNLTRHHETALRLFAALAAMALFAGVPLAGARLLQALVYGGQ